jgi:2-phospho-L-lactate guanylyltransferase
VQATVHSFDPATGEGSVLLDDGRRVPFDPAAFEHSGLRLVRLGQRVTIELSDEPLTVRRLGIRGVPAS